MAHHTERPLTTSTPLHAALTGAVVMLVAACQPAAIATTTPTTAASPTAATSPTAVATSTPTLPPTATPIPPTPTSTPVPPTPTLTPTPRPPSETRSGERQIAAPGGLGNTLTDFRQNFGPGQQVTGPQATYQFQWKQGDRTLSVQFWLSRRAGAIRVDLPEPYRWLVDSYGVATEYLPYDAKLIRQPSANLQHYRSQQFSDVMPDELLGETASAGDVFVRFNLRDGRVASFVVGSGHPAG